MHLVESTKVANFEHHHAADHFDDGTMRLLFPNEHVFKPNSQQKKPKIIEKNLLQLTVKGIFKQVQKASRSNDFVCLAHTSCTAFKIFLLIRH